MNEIERRKSIGQFWQVNNKLGETFCCQTFCEFGSFQENGVFTLERFESGETLERKSGSGRKPLKLP